MKRWVSLAAVLMCLVLFFTPVTADAASAASKVDLMCSVNVDGDCLVSMTVNFRLEAADENLMFPLPLAAENITLNGSNVSTVRTSTSQEVSLLRVTSGAMGEFTARFDYTIPKTVKVEKINQGTITERKILQLTLPMLSGFSYPVETITFAVTMPGDVEIKPDFYSTYRQNSIESSMVCTLTGNMITGSTTTALNDHEALTMTTEVPKEMFPSVSTYQREGNPEVYPMVGIAAAALLFWLLFMRNMPMSGSRSNSAPEGVSAGELTCRLTLTGSDLSMMILSWANLGYLIIKLEDNGRVLLHKRMEMGNERSLFEIRVFRSIFGERRVVDCTSMNFARQLAKTAKMLPGESTMCRGKLVYAKIFRTLCCAVHVFCGICVAMNMTANPALQVLLSIAFVLLAIPSALVIQQIAYRIYFRGRFMKIAGIAAIVIWVLLGLICGQVLIPLCASLFQLLAGWMAAFGGRRTELNRQDAAQILGLRRYLKTLEKDEITRQMAVDPEFFFRMIPYAMSLGVLKPYTLAFGKRKLHQCPYLITEIHGKRTPEQWASLLEETVIIMESRYRQMELDRYIPIQRRPAAPPRRPAPKKRPR